MTINKKIYLMAQKVDNMGYDLRKLKTVLNIRPNVDHSEEIEEVKARVRENISDILELLDAEETEHEENPVDKEALERYIKENYKPENS